MSQPTEDAIRSALELVEGAGLDPDSRAGSVVLRYALETNHRCALGAPPQKVESGQNGSDAQGSGEAGDPAGSVAAWANVPREAVEDNFEFGAEGGLVKVKTHRLPAQKGGKQTLIGILKLAIDRVGYGQEEVSTRAVNAALAEYKAVDQNVFKHLVGRGDFVSRRGQRGNYSYRLTQPGVEKALELMRSIAEGNEQLSI
jgi:hypothetical protein